MNGDVQYDLATLEFKNKEQLEYFHRRIIKLQQEIILSGGTISHTILLFQYMKSHPNIDKIKEFIAPKMADTTKLLDNNGKLAVYTGGNIKGLYCYIESIGSPITLTISSQRYHHFGPSSYTNNDTSTLQLVISDLYIIQKIICECCGRNVQG